jgi:hypothetical protein
MDAPAESDSEPYYHGIISFSLLRSDPPRSLLYFYPLLPAFFFCIRFLFIVVPDIIAVQTPSPRLALDRIRNMYLRTALYYRIQVDHNNYMTVSK